MEEEKLVYDSGGHWLVSLWCGNDQLIGCRDLGARRGRISDRQCHKVINEANLEGAKGVVKGDLSGREGAGWR